MAGAGATRWLDGVESRARALLPDHILEYVLQGAGASTSAGEAASAWAALRFAPRVLRDVSTVDLSVSLLGESYAACWGVAPSTLQRSVHPDGELAMARACADAGALLVVSSNAGTGFAEIGATGVGWWVQAYLPQDRSLAKPMLDRAVAAGARAVVLTVDTPVVGRKLTASGRVVFEQVPAEHLRVNFEEGYDALPGSEKARDLAAEDLEWLADFTGLPVVVKGVLRADDAGACVDAGARGVWVSNHGGRQLDRALPTAHALPGVAAAVGDRAEVYVDGGITGGLGVLAALGLGARAAFLGRLPLLALAEGQEGVARLHAELREEVTEALTLAGCTRPEEAVGLVVSPPARP